ncbi:hypothetical protein AGOR_G00194980 [Albula goreensis]|uniref:Immunoglobulin subtype domain-containing protein n=1 Tax=Albula goreensis TaxID=1534307 RepID=A0A8T3CRR8_9TELE|nr:hypothetical protein AGOR_G00194980 [Albula goreensis]
MKIVICVTLLCVAGVSSVQELSGLVNGSVEIPTAVKNGGTLSYNKNIIVDITNGKVSVVGAEFAGRIKWNSRTGVLSISDLQMEDAGDYEVQADNQRSEYQLTVYKRQTQSLWGKNVQVALQ